MKIIMIVPIIVAVIMLGYGIYSVKSNLSNLTASFERLYLISNSGTISYLLKEAKGQAIASWVITSIVYLITSEVTTIIVRNNIYSLFKRDELNENTEIIHMQG